MRKILWCLGILALVLDADETTLQRQIVHIVVQALTAPSTTIAIYSDKPRRAWDLLHDGDTVHIVNKPQRANLCLFFERYEKGLCREKPIFFLSRHLFRHHAHDAAAAFYWQKGRPNVIFCKEWLRKHRWQLPDDLQKFTAECEPF